MASTKTVEIENFAYKPGTLTIEAGDSVKWLNKDDMIHTATRTASPAFDTGSLHKNEESQPILFSEVSGEVGFKYRCKPHPFMGGIVIVVTPQNPESDVSYEKKRS